MQHVFYKTLQCGLFKPHCNYFYLCIMQSCSLAIDRRYFDLIHGLMFCIHQTTMIFAQHIVILYLYYISYSHGELFSTTFEVKKNLFRLYEDKALFAQQKIDCINKYFNGIKNNSTPT